MVPPAMRRRRWLALSQISSAPLLIECQSVGLGERGRCGWAAVAGESRAAVAGEGGDDAVGHGADALVAGIGDVEGAVRPDRDRLRRVQFGGDSCAAVSREALHAAARNDQPCAGERGLKDLVAGGVRDVEISGSVVSDARGFERGWRGSLRGSGGRHHAARCESGRA
jgi:hypothetical protein